MDIELRLLHRAEVRAVESGDKKQLAGYAAKYNVRSHTIGSKFQEQIRSGAFDGVMRKRQDVVALVNHDTNFPLGRTGSGTLRLNADSIGLAYELDLGNQSYARDLYESVKRGDIKGCSFAFQLDKGVDDEWDEEDSMAVRTIKNFRTLGDISFVTMPAYPETTVDARQLELVTAEARSRAKATVQVELRNKLAALIAGPCNPKTIAEADRIVAELGVQVDTRAAWRQHKHWRSCCEYMGIDADRAGLPELVAAIERSDKQVVARQRAMTEFLLS